MESIILIATPRSGSTSYAHYLAKSNPPLVCFGEPEKTADGLMSFLNYYNSGNKFVLKFIVSEQVHYPNYIIEHIKSGNVRRIGLVRRNMVEQLASLYWANVIQQWHYLDDDPIFQIPELETIDHVKLSFYAKGLLFCYKQLNSFSLNETIYYEDLDNFDSRYEITPKPKNYSLLIDASAKALLNN